MCVVYNFVVISHRLNQMLSFLLIDVKLTIIDEFHIIIRALHVNDRLNRIVIDETHLILIVAHYRSHLLVLKKLRRVQCFFVCMIVTLSFFVESQLRDVLHITHCETLRANSDRINLKYRMMIDFRKIFDDEFFVIDDEKLITIIVRVCFFDVRK